MRNCGAGLVTGQLLAVPFAILYSTVPFFVEFHEFYDLTHRSIAYKNTWYPFRFSWNYHELSKNCISAFRLLDATQPGLGILRFCQGTRGDFQPVLSLGLGLVPTLATR